MTRVDRFKVTHEFNHYIFHENLLSKDKYAWCVGWDFDEATEEEIKILVPRQGSCTQRQAVVHQTVHKPATKHVNKISRNHTQLQNILCHP